MQLRMYGAMYHRIRGACKTNFRPKLGIWPNQLLRLKEDLCRRASLTVATTPVQCQESHLLQILNCDRCNVSGYVFSSLSLEIIDSKYQWPLGREKIENAEIFLRSF